LVDDVLLVLASQLGILRIGGIAVHAVARAAGCGLALAGGGVAGLRRDGFHRRHHVRGIGGGGRRWHRGAGGGRRRRRGLGGRRRGRGVFRGSVLRGRRGGEGEHGEEGKRLPE